MKLKRVSKNNWKVVESKRGNNTSIKSPAPSPAELVTSNRFSSLSVHDPEMPPNKKHKSLNNCSKKPSRLFPTICKENKPDQNVKPPLKKDNQFRRPPSVVNAQNTPHFNVYGDSHVRNLSSILTNKLKHKYKFCCDVKPNAKMENILSGIKKDKVESGDVIVIVGGTNNIDVNGRFSSFTTELNSFFTEVSLPRILLVGLPFRNDNPFLNPTISKVNNDMLALSGEFENVTFVPLDTMSRHLFTGHGLHFNFRGKVVLASLLLSALKTDSKHPDNKANHSKSSSLSKPLDNRIYVNQQHKSKSQIPPYVSPNRTFINKDFLGEAKKPPEIPWALYLKKEWGINMRA